VTGTAFWGGIDFLFGFVGVVDDELFGNSSL